jgi:hypothetical protein
MKPKITSCAIKTLLGLLLFVSLSLHSFGQVPPPPPPPNGGPGSGHGLGGNQGAANAPIGGGIGILLALGALYSGRKFLASSFEDTDNEPA